LEAYGSYFYLETGINENDNKNLAFLTRTLQRAASSGNTLISGYYLSSLAIKSQSNGAWGNSVYESALSVIALRTASDYAQQVSAGKDYIKSQWLPADNWDESIEATSWSLLALNDYERLKQVTIPITTPDGNPITDDGGAVEICFNGVDDDLDTLIDCNDEVDCANTNYCKYCTNGIFDEDFEEQTDCGKVCPACGDGNGTKLSSEFGIYCTDTIDNDGDMVTDCADSDCASNQACLVDVDNRESECTSDMDCGVNEICTNGACVSSSDQQTTDQGGSSAGLIIILVILILLVIGGGVLFYIKFIKTGKISFGKKSSKPTTSFNSYTSSRPLPSGPIIPQARQPAAPARPIMPSRPLPRPITPVSKPVSKEDDELEQSLKKAEKLLYGDKK
jgi:hypothetical protein